MTMDTLREAEETITEATKALDYTLKEQFSILENVTIYSSHNILIASANFTLDLYDYRDFKHDMVKFNCSTNSTRIPTEAEAVAHVRGLQDEKEFFMEAVEYLISIMGVEYAV